MREVTLLEQSVFSWVSLGDDQQALMAGGFEAWSRVVFRGGQWHAIGGLYKDKTRLLTTGERARCLAAANDWMKRQETDDCAHKTKDG